MALAFPVLLAAILDPRIQPLLDRVSEEARVFAEQSLRFVGVETMTQKGRIAPPRFRLRKGADPSEAPAVAYRTTKMVSEYGFGYPPAMPSELKEIRVVTAVNDRPIRDQKKARLALAEGMQSDLDRLAQQMLLDMESYGLVGAVSDVGQILLLFSRQRLGDFEFTVQPDAIHDGETVTVLGYRQIRGPGANVYHREVAHPMLSGELWIRGNGQPLRVTAEMPVKEGKYSVVHSFLVDYSPARNGVLLPAQTRYSRVQDSVLMVETSSVYTEYKMFAVDAEIKFLAEGDPEQ